MDDGGRCVIDGEDFVHRFDEDPSTFSVGIIGHGYVGKAIHEYFKETYRVRVHDKAKPELGDLDGVVLMSDVIFVCVPTPMDREDGGRCHTGIVEDVLRDIGESSKRQGRRLDSFVVVIKSTVRPGFTEEMQDRHLPMRIVFSPEFLTEKNSVSDFKKQGRIVLGGDVDDARVVFKFFEGADRTRVAEGRLQVLTCHPTVAEMVKLYTNGILAAKVAFSNEVYQVCLALGLDYEEVRSLALLDRRIGSSHTTVPGHDGKLGFGGSCFPKDINNLRHTAISLGTPDRVFSAIIESNGDVRPERDWEQLTGRSVV